MIAILHAFICSLMITSGQILWKLAINKHGGILEGNIRFKSLLSIFINPYMISGIAIYGFATLYWMYLIGKYEYSYIYPMMAITYIISLVAAYYIFNEDIGLMKIFGVGFIIVGVVFITKS